MGRTFYISNFYCTKCGNKGIPVPRKAYKIRGKYHLKKLFCPHCKIETNHIEVREDDYDLIMLKPQDLIHNLKERGIINE